MSLFKKSPSVRPLLNLGCLMDIPTGRYRVGVHGESTLNGGLAHITGIGGAGNTFKSTLAHYMTLICVARHIKASAVVYDTEISLMMERLVELSWWMDEIGEGLIEEIERVILGDKTTQSANEWFEAFKSFLAEKRKDPKNNRLKTPFLDKDGKQIEAPVPSLFEIDSLSQMDFDVVLTMQEKNEVGSSGMNMEAMKAASAKSQMLNQLPGIAGSSGAHVILTAHVGEEHQLDPMSPPKKKLAFLKQGIKFKNVPEKFTFLTNNCWYVTGSKPLQNQSTKGAEYPRTREDVMSGDTDLFIINVLNVRAKSGPTGMPIDIIVSQKEGILPSLSEFHYVKTNGRFGLGGHDRAYYFELKPEVSMQRTTVRSKLREDYRLRRAAEITAEMCQMKNLWFDTDNDKHCSPAILYEDLKGLGYDWDILLNTRGWWAFEGCEPEDLPFLSTMDLLNMRKKEYHPWWYDKVAKAKEKAEGKTKDTADKKKSEEQETE